MGHDQKLLLSEMVFFWNFERYLGQQISSLKTEKGWGKKTSLQRNYHGHLGIQSIH